MSNETRIAELEGENQQLRLENQQLKAIIIQMKSTLDRLLNRYVLENKETKQIGSVRRE